MGSTAGLSKSGIMSGLQCEPLPQVPSHFRSVLGDECPKIDIGDQRTSPYECAFHTLCTPPGPEYPVGILYRRGKHVQELIDVGYIDLTEVARELLRGELYVRQCRASREVRWGDC